MKIALCLLLASSFASAQITANAGAHASSSSPSSATVNSAPDPALTEFLGQMKAAAQKSDADIGHLRVDKWKVDSASKQQAEAAALSVRRNLTNAVPDLVQHIQDAPGSVNANFKLYRNLNVLYDTFSSLVESAGAFGPKEQYEPLAADIAQLDQLRRQIAERVDLLTGASDAEIVRLRSLSAAVGSKTPSKIVVNDDQPQPKSKKKATATPAQPQPAAK